MEKIPNQGVEEILDLGGRALVAETIEMEMKIQVQEDGEMAKKNGESESLPQVEVLQPCSSCVL